MSHDQIAHLYRNRHRLGRAELEWAARRAAVIDAHHVAKVHQRYGIVDGFEINAGEEMLEVGPGSAYTPCGDLVTVTRPSRFGRPATSGRYEITLDPEGVVRVAGDESPRPTGWLHLGSIDARQTSSTDARIAWVASTVLTGWRLAAAEHRRAHVASGVEHVAVAAVSTRQGAFGVSRRINTANARFSDTPLYFASVSVTSAGDFGVRWENGGFMTGICDAAPAAFTLDIRLAGDAVRTIAAASVPAGYEVGLVIRWLGALPDRPGPHHLDPSCSPPPSRLI